MDNRIIHEVAECTLYQGEWLVEAINYKGDGECYMARFSGPFAEERAKDYTAWQNGRIMLDALNS